MPATDLLDDLEKNVTKAPVPTSASPPASNPARRWNLPQWEWVAAVTMSFLVAGFHMFFSTQVGAPWRDEVNSIHLANLYSFAETWDNLQYDSFPILFFIVLKGWGSLFSVYNDTAFRALGCLIGLGIFTAFWFNARKFGYRWPVITLAFLGCNPQFIRYADSMRAYGLGILLMLLTFGAVWRVVESLTMRRVAAAAVLGLLAVQTLYYNSVLLLSICMGGAIVAAYTRQWKKACWILAIGVPAAGSLLIYRETIRRLNEWNFLVKYPVDPWLYWNRFLLLIGCTDRICAWIWCAVFLGACVLAGRYLLARRRVAADDSTPDDRRTDLAVGFALTTLVVGTIGYACFLCVLRYYTQPWYFIAYLALAGVCLDVIFGRLAVAGQTHGQNLWRWALPGFAVLLAAYTFFPVCRSLSIKQTNLDLAAAKVARGAVAGDVILQMYWERGITFARYYHGPAEQLTLPIVKDHRIHRYNEVLQQLTSFNPMEGVYASLGNALRGGHKVWIVGELVSTPKGWRPPPLTPPKKQADGWYIEASASPDLRTYASAYVIQHAAHGGMIPIATNQQVSGYENTTLSVVWGWKDNPPANAVVPPVPTVAAPES